MSNCAKTDSIIDYGAFQLNTAPFTGRSYFDFAAKTYGFPTGYCEKPFKVTIVRHPLDWLIQIWANAAYLTVPENNPELQFLTAVACRYQNDFARFLTETTKYPEIIGKSFGNYPADSAIRFEDFPWAALELFGTFMARPDSKNTEKILETKMDQGSDHTYFSKLDIQVFRSTLRKSEAAFMERYDYV